MSEEALTPQVIETTALEVITRAETSTSVDIAKRYPRVVSRFKSNAMSLATADQETAEQCFYHLPRGRDGIFGPSVRLAEILGSSWGNIQVAARIVEVGATHVTAQGAAWDMETNYRVTEEVKRSIMDRSGRRYNDDMINVTCNAACSIARRNATFACIPKAYWSKIYEECRTVAVGDSRSLAENVGRWMAWAQKAGVSDERVLASIGVEDSADISLKQLAVLSGKATAIRDGDITVDTAFPPVKAEPDPSKSGVKKKVGGKSKPKAEKKAAEKVEPKPDKAEPAPAAEPMSPEEVAAIDEFA